MNAFENISQRVVFSYRRQLVPFTPIILEPIAASEREAMQDSQKDLHAFFDAFYGCAYDNPATFGLPVSEDVCVSEEDGKDKKRNVTAQVKKARIKMEYGIDFLRFLGEQGTLVGNDLWLDVEAYAAFLAKGPGMKRKMLKGLATVGLTVSESGNGLVMSNSQYPAMMAALSLFAQACARIDDERMARFHFSRCDFRMLDADHHPEPLDVLRATVSSPEYEHALALHRALVEMAYVPSLVAGGVHDWRIRYQGRRAVKSTPFFEFEYDERQHHELHMYVKCASTNRLVPLLAQQPASLQEDFFRHTYTCGGATCGWCKTRKALGPSKIEHGGETKTICWYMQRRFAELNGEVVDLIEQYASLHEALAAA